MSTSDDEADLVIEPKVVDEDHFSQQETKNEQDVSKSPTEAATELPRDNVESEEWPGQPYETFQVNRPEAEAVEEIWPDLVLAEEVELLGRQKSSDNVASTEKTPNSHPTSATESDVVDAQAVAEDMTVAQGVTEAEQAWQTPLSDGQKGEWT